MEHFEARPSCQVNDITIKAAVFVNGSCDLSIYTKTYLSIDVNHTRKQEGKSFS